MENETSLIGSKEAEEKKIILWKEKQCTAESLEGLFKIEKEQVKRMKGRNRLMSKIKLNNPFRYIPLNTEQKHDFESYHEFLLVRIEGILWRSSGSLAHTSSDSSDPACLICYSNLYLILSSSMFLTMKFTHFIFRFELWQVTWLKRVSFRGM